ncbi:MAG: Sir2 family NAD-dependent protein deacetylase [Alphaproteobacteria bacterium]|nr:Sir2 family NAD-dependent protein deacetylase [Alphaproteobacteria bacterium]
MTTTNGGVDALSRLIDEAKRAVVFTGAGISTESGIPDFRSPGGLWEKYKPVMYQDFLASDDAKREYWRQRFARADDMITAEPNRGHRAVEKLVRTGKVSAVITQNIDGLHQRSGVPEEKIIELHGNSTYASCLDCNARYEVPPIREQFLKDETLPVCMNCGGVVKTATISFGQAMPEDAMRAAQIETLQCDLFLSIGSSLQVYPAAGFPLMAREHGASLVILNRDPTDLDRYANLVLNEEIGPTLGDVVGVN